MKNYKKQAMSSEWSLMHWGLLTTLVLGTGTLVAFVITRDSVVLSWATGILGTTFGGVVGSVHNRNQRELPSPGEE